MTGPLKDEVAAMVERLRTQLVMSMFLTRDDLYRAQEKQRRDASYMIETITAQLAASEAARVADEARVGGGLEAAAKELLEQLMGSYKAKNGKRVELHADDGEKCWIIHSDFTFALEAALKGAKP